MNTLTILLYTCVGGAVIIGGAHMVVMSLRRVLSASVRHAFWATSLVCMFVLPFLIGCVSPNSVVIPRRLVPLVLSSKTAVSHGYPTLASSAGQATEPGPANNKPVEIPGIQQIILATNVSPQHLAKSSRHDLSLAFLLTWALVAGALIVRLTLSIALTRRIKSSSQTLDLGLLEGNRINGRVVVILAPLEAGAVSPMTWGIVKPVIALPHCAMEWPEERRRTALLHELAHVTRWDWLLQTFAQVVCAVYWFHPLVWYAARQLRVESERACDDLVVAAGRVAPADYASHLLDIARSARNYRIGGALSMAHGGDIGPRLRAVLAEKAPRRAISARDLGIIMVLAAIGLYLTASVRVTVAQPQWGSPPPDAGFLQTAEALSGYSAAFPGVSDIKLVALTIPKISSAPWWSPAGRRLATAPVLWPTNFGGGMPLPPNMKIVGVVLKTHFDKGFNSTFGLPTRVSYLDPSQNLVGLSASGTGTVSKNDEWTYDEVRIPKTSQSCVVEVAEPSMQWHKLGEWRAGGKNTASAPVWQASSTQPGVDASLTIGTPPGVNINLVPQRGGANRQIEVDFDLKDFKNGYYVRLIPIGKDGQILKLSPSGTSQSNNHFQDEIILNEPVASVREFKLEECEYEWKQFPAVNVDVPK